MLESKSIIFIKNVRLTFIHPSNSHVMQAVSILLNSNEEEYQWIVNAKLCPTNFAPLYKKYYHKIFNYIEKRMQNKDLSSDIAAQVFSNALQRIHSFEYKGYSFGAWLYRIAHNEMCQEYRNFQKNKLIDFDENQCKSMIFQVENNELEDKLLLLESAMKKVKRNYLQIIELRYFENLSFKEIGIRLGISENTAKVRCFRAVDKLKEIYKLIE